MTGTTTACLYCGRPHGHSCDCGEWVRCAGGCGAQVPESGPERCPECFDADEEALAMHVADHDALRKAS